MTLRRGSRSFLPLAETRSQLEKLAELLQWKDAPQLGHWQETLQHAEARLQQAKVRIAVLGAVKSGKSTLLNALLGADRPPPWGWHSHFDCHSDSAWRDQSSAFEIQIQIVT
jgi:ribosome biogenesis GTPase A